MADLPPDENIEAEDFTSIPIIDRLDPTWVKSIKVREQTEVLVSSTSSRFQSSISKVIRGLRRYNEDAYNPQLISIGPFHHGKRQLQSMERHKWRYLHAIFSRINLSNGLEMVLGAVKDEEKRARSYYSEAIDLDSNSFVEMMVLDGCFILELFYKNYKKIDDPNLVLEDPILDLKLLKKAVMADLVKIENQIPFFVLQLLFQRTFDSSSSDPTLVKSALLYFDELNSNTNQDFNPPPDCSFQHLLHLIHSSLPSKEVPQEKTVFKRIPCASKLEEGGVEFKVRKLENADGDFMLIKFDNGVLEIPPIEVWNKTYILFLNLIAFEQSNRDSRKNISAYTAFMDCLINTSKDVEILCQRGIIDNGLGNEKLVASLFNHMGRELTVYDDDFYLSGVCQKINAHSDRIWPKMRASLVHDYFKNPWAIISFIAALVLLLLTTTQTFFSSFPKFAYGN